MAGKNTVMSRNTSPSGMVNRIVIMNGPEKPDVMSILSPDVNNTIASTATQTHPVEGRGLKILFEFMIVSPIVQLAGNLPAFSKCLARRPQGSVFLRDGVL